MRWVRQAWRDRPLVAGLLLLWGGVLAFTPDLYPFMLLRAFLWQWAVAFIVLALWNVVLRRWWTAAASLCCTALVCIPPASIIVAGPVPPESRHLLRVAQMNVLQENRKYAEVVREALASHADIISFQEVDPIWAAVLDQGLAEDYPYRRTVAGTDRYGIAIYSKSRFSDARILDLQGRPAVHAVLMLPDTRVTVLCVHASSPGSYSNFKQRNAQLAQVQALLSEVGGPVLVVGDLNTVSWDQALRDLSIRTGLREAREAPNATWPTAFGKSLIPLDHILVSPDLGLSGLRPLHIPGSDHRGLVVNVALRP